jgi:hypothetical protein
MLLLLIDGIGILELGMAVELMGMGGRWTAESMGMMVAVELMGRAFGWGKEF